MSSKDNYFFGKLLLFGEYSVLSGSMALSIPYHKFRAKLTFKSNGKTEISKNLNHQLRLFLEYLKSDSNHFKSILNLSQLEKDIDSGLYFDSSIPVSYGLGSSGALCAALYKHYGISKNIINNDLSLLKEFLSALEAGFHGKSSGLDPLISYMNKPILVSGKNKINVVDLKTEEFNKEETLILIDTRQKSNTAPLVTSFLDQCKKAEFNKKITDYLIPVTNQCINSFCNNEIDVFFRSIKLLSEFQYNNFEDKIPNGFKKLWKTGINSEEFSLKLCGSGGGGFLLCFTKNITETELFMNKMGYSCQRTSFNF